MMSFINLNGRIIPENECLVPATSRAVSYGDGCFETLRSYQGKFLDFDKHFERLQAGLNYLDMKSDLSEEQLRIEIQNLLEKNGLLEKDTVIRVQCFREGKGGYFDLSDTSGYVISNREIGSLESELTLKTVSVRAIPSVSLERKVKLSNSINYIKAAQEAQNAGFDDALMLTVNKEISETTIANVFWIKGNQVFTSSIDCDLLPGITRSIIIDLIDERSDLEVKQGKFELEELYTAEAVFCCNSVMEIKYVSKIDERAFDISHEVITKLQKDFQNYKSMNLK